MRRRFSVCVAGLGKISDIHLSALEKIDNTVITGLCDIDIEKAERAREKYAQGAKVFSDYIEMLDTVRPDAVHICTPHKEHAKMAKEAFARNINVVLEKPMCLKEEEIEEILQAEANSKAVGTVVFQNRYLVRNRVAKDYVDSIAGRILGFRVFVSLNRRDESYYKDAPWHGITEECGGILMTQAIHALDYLVFTCGAPTSVSAACSRLWDNPLSDMDTACSAYLTFENGAGGIYYASTDCRKNFPAFIEFFCENCTVTLQENGLYINGKEVTVSDSNFYFSNNPYKSQAHVFILDDFYRSVMKGEKPPVTLDDAARTMKAAFAMMRSNGKRIEL